MKTSFTREKDGDKGKRQHLLSSQSICHGPFILAPAASLLLTTPCYTFTSSRFLPSAARLGLREDVEENFTAASDEFRKTAIWNGRVKSPKFKHVGYCGVQLAAHP